MFVSRADPRLRVVRKENGGRSDALNAGLNVARSELVAIVDGNTLLEPDALKRTAEAFAADPDNLVAVGGTLRIANGALIQSNTVVEARIAGTGVAASQAAEYLRGFLGGRLAWSWKIPTSLAPLRTQRIRWHVGLIDNLLLHGAWSSGRGTARSGCSHCLPWLGDLLAVSGRPGWGSLPRGSAFGDVQDTKLVSAPLPR
jgi:glycosyltransferase involved in cell wall biosynthesis